MSTASSGIDNDPEDFDLDYLQKQVRLIASLTSEYGPPPRANVIAAGRLAADLRDKIDNTTRELPQPVHDAVVVDVLLTTLCALAALLEQPEAGRRRLHRRYGKVLHDEAVEFAASDAAKWLDRMVNGGPGLRIVREEG